jgi:U3 small nucleolar RNA-associated protein 14
MSGISSYEEGVNIEELIDLIDQEDTVDSVAKSALKNRLENFNKGPVIFIQRAVAILGNSKRRELDRKITYQLASQEISKWQEAVNTQRSAEQLNLTTPLPPAQSL